MSKNVVIAFIFPNTNYAMEAESLLAKAKLHPNFLALPGDLGLGCGTAVTVLEGGEKQAIAVLKKNSVSVLSIWIVGKNGEPWKPYKR
ncbi:MAG: DUF3343 domain-containing protein [Clostridiales bacterium]